MEGDATCASLALIITVDIVRLTDIECRLGMPNIDILCVQTIQPLSLRRADQHAGLQFLLRVYIGRGDDNFDREVRGRV
jgi:hypothetical protein